MKKKIKLLLNKTLCIQSCTKIVSIEHIGIKIEPRKGNRMIWSDRLPRQRSSFFRVLSRIDKVTETDTLSQIMEHDVMEAKDD